jgi:gamma-glutamylcyclotransferase (GGCT)/AIG2-like uncharacterized protein YtfP
MMGMENYAHYERHLKYLGKTLLQGFRMYSLKQYPYVIKTNDSRNIITAELYKIMDEKTEQSIHEMELDEGYIFSEVNIADDKFGIYLFESHVVNTPEIINGDWRSYRNLQRF